MTTRRFGPRHAPHHFIQHATDNDPSERHWLRGMTCAVVPFEHSRVDRGAGAFGTAKLRDLYRGHAPSFDGGLVLAGEAAGLAVRSIGAGFRLGVVGALPRVAPLTCFALIFRRDNSNTIQSLMGTGSVGNAGWTFQLNYGTGQLGLTRWGIADHPANNMDVHQKKVVAVAVAHDGSNLRFMVDGEFQTVASGAITTNSTFPQFFMNHSGATPAVDCSLFVAYAWERALRDSELLALMADPWRIVRRFERSRHRVAGAGGPPAGSAISGRGLIGVVGG